MSLTKEAALRKDRRSNTTVMQHRHFAVISQLIATLDHPTRLYVAVHFANGLGKHNPNFNRERFLNACEGIAPPVPKWFDADGSDQVLVISEYRKFGKLLLIEPNVDEWMKDFEPTKGDTK